MFTSFFGKSKPINFILIIIFMVIFFIAANFHTWFVEFSYLVFFKKLLVLLVFLFSMGVLNFIANKNDLTKRSAFKILFFAVFSTSFFALLQNHQVIVANLFVLLGLRRIISIKSGKEVQKKIFDASLWICIASLFYFWTILFLIIIYVGILMYASHPKNWLVPAVSFLAVAILTISFHLLAYDQFFTLTKWYQESHFNFSAYGNPEFLIPISLILAVMIWTLLFYVSLIQRSSITQRPSFILILFALFTAIAVAIFSPTKNGSELIFFFVPLSIIASNYFDSKRDKFFKEVLLLLLILMPLSISFLL